MGHQITNEHEALFSNKPAWHGLGTVFAPGESEGMTTDKVRELAPSIFAERKLLPVYGSVTGAPLIEDTVISGSDLIGGGKVRLIARTDGPNAKVHGVATSDYKIWQVDEAFAFLDSLVREGSMQYESVFALNGGDQVVMVCRLPGAYTVGKSDKTLQFVMVRVPFTGAESIAMVPTMVRVVCANTVAAAFQDAGQRGAAEGRPHIFRLRHTKGLTERLAEARQHLASFDQALQAEAEAADKLAGRALSKRESEWLLNTLFPIFDDDGTELSKRARAGRDRRVEALRGAWVTERDSFRELNEAALVGSAYHMLQAFTRAVDHGDLIRRRGSARERAEKHYVSILEGAGAQLKIKARDKLLTLV